MMRLLGFAALVGCLAGCGDDADACASPADCMDGERCVNGFCVPTVPDGGESDAGDDASDDAGGEDAPSDVGVDATSCGNGTVEPGEDCDDGEAGNSDSDPDACRTNCRNPGCGDAVIDTGERCDDGNTMPRDGCDGMCRVEAECVVAHLGGSPARIGTVAIADDGTALATEELLLSADDNTIASRPARHHGIALCGRTAIAAVRGSNELVSIAVAADGSLMELARQPLSGVREVACNGSFAVATSVQGGRRYQATAFMVGGDGTLMSLDTREDALPTFGIERVVPLFRPGTNEVWVVTGTNDELFFARAMVGMGGFSGWTGAPSSDPRADNINDLEAVVFSPDGAQLITSERDCTLLWDPTGAFPPNVLDDSCGSFDRLFDVAFTENRTVFGSDDSRITGAMTEGRIDPGGTTPVSGDRSFLTPLHDGAFLASVGYRDGQVRVFPIDTDGNLGMPTTDENLFMTTFTRGIETLGCALGPDPM